jgi:ClpP class serine protease
MELTPEIRQSLKDRGLTDEQIENITNLNNDETKRILAEIARDDWTSIEARIHQIQDTAERTEARKLRNLLVDILEKYRKGVKVPIIGLELDQNTKQKLFNKAWSYEMARKLSGDSDESLSVHEQFLDELST